MTDVGPPLLSPFQTLMREWSRLAPYNFIHALRLPSRPDMELLKRALPGAMQELDLPPTGVIERTTADLHSHVSSELQRAFPPDEAPIRFFMLDGTDGRQWLGAVVDHWIADDFSCRQLLQRIYSMCYGKADQVEQPCLTSAQPGRQGTAWWKSWGSFLRQALNLRRVCRTPLRDPLDFRVQTFTALFPEGALDSIQRVTKQQAVTVHDLFLAATAQAFGAAYIGNHRPKRDAVAIPSAMDLRRFRNEQDRSGFGMLVGQYLVSQRRPHEVPLVQLAKRIAIQTRRLKAAPEDLFSPALFLWRLSRSPHAKATFFERGAPCVAGLSNVNLTGSWIERCQIPEYRRFGPTGPVIPMLLMITTLHNRISIDVTFRTTALGRPEAEALVADIIRHCMNLVA